MRTLVIGLTGVVVAGVGLLAVPDASAIIVRHDVPDAEYVVADADYPALVDLISRGDCIGTLIHESFVLSVAHCAVDLSMGDSLEVGGDAHVVAGVYLHPEWTDRDKYDIALVRLEQPVTDVDPIPIYRGSDELGAMITLVGRGVTATGMDGEAGGHTDGKLRRATNVVSAANDQFLQIVFERPGQNGVTDLEGVGAAGDSGCPAFLDVDGTPYVAGLNSWGDGQPGIGIGQYGALDYQTRVSRFADWLDDVIESRAESTPDSDPHTDEDWSRVVPGSILALLLVIGVAVGLRSLRTRARDS
ncbi:MAG: S1 family peptidase [Nocardioidaceae bacterium]